MGIIGDGKEAIRQAQEALPTFEQIRDEQISRALHEANGLIMLPEYEGDVESALVHHFGREAFDDDISGTYLELVKKLEEKGKNKDSIPVLFVFSPGSGRSYYDYGHDSRTALVEVNPEQINFRSAIDREEVVLMNAYTGQTAGVTYRTLMLRGKTIEIDDDIFFDSEGSIPIPTEESPMSGLALSRSRHADNGMGRNKMGDHQFNDTAHNRLSSENAIEIFVGWEEIEGAVEFALAGKPAQEAFSYIANLHSFFREAKMLTKVRRGAPRLHAKFQSAGLFERELGQSAIRS